jgi:hypothetical protein
MFGTLRVALTGRKVAFNHETFGATVDGRISGVGRTLRITSIHVHDDIAVPPGAGEAIERAAGQAVARTRGRVRWVVSTREGSPRSFHSRPLTGSTARLSGHRWRTLREKSEGASRP